MARLGSGAGARNKHVTLWRNPQTSNDSDGFWEALSPPDAWAAITPQLGGIGRSTEYVVEMPYHPQVTMDARVLYTTSDYALELFVKSVQNLNQDDTVMVLTCESVTA